MKTKISIRLFWILSGAVLLTWVACYPPTISVDQPELADMYAPFEVEVIAEGHGNNSVEQIFSRVGLQLPAGLAAPADRSEETPYRLIFGIEMPVGWTVTDSIPFTGVDEGIFVHSDFLSDEMTTSYPPPSGYYWWASETVENMSASSGQIYYTPVITTSGQKGNFFLSYSLGHWNDSSLWLANSFSNDHLITCGLDDTVYVTGTGDAGQGSLRAAIDSVSTYGTILFDLPLPNTIHLSQEINMYKNLTIQGPESQDILISGEGACRVFYIPGQREIHLSNLQIINGFNSDYGGGIYCSSGSQGTMTNLRIRNNTADMGGGICFQGAADLWNLTGVTISGNAANCYGGGIYGNNPPALDETERCNIYSNSAPLGSDLYFLNGCSSVIYLDTFTVIQPNDYWAWPQELYEGFDILHCDINLLDQPVYVSPSGSDNNSGISPDCPFKTIGHALKMTFADPQDPNVIHLGTGTYSPTTNGESFPLYANSHIRLLGQGGDISVITGSTILKCISDIGFSVEGIGMTFSASQGIIISGSDISFIDFKIWNNAGIQCNGSNLSMVDGILTSIGYYNNAVISASGSSVINLTGLHFYNNQKPLLTLGDDYATLNQCLIENNGCHDGNNLQMIRVAGNSVIELSNTTIKNNICARAMTIAGTAAVWFDPANLCNIFNNACLKGKDFNAENYSGANPIEVTLDTFSVMYPNDYYAYPLDKFLFNNYNGKNQQISQNMYVSVQGSDENSGLAADDPLRTLTKACQLYYPMMDNQSDTIFLADGEYGEGEIFPVYPSSGITIAGNDRTSTSIFGGTINISNKNQVAIKDLSLINSGGIGLQVNGSELFLDHCDLLHCSRAVSIMGNTTITGDSAFISNNVYGIYMSDASVILHHLSINNNTIYGIESSNSYLECHNLVMAGNGNTGSSQTNLGGIRVNNGQVTILNSVFEGNHSRNVGGAIFFDNSGGILINNSFIGNSAVNAGGALYCNGSSENLPVILINGCLEENTGQNGGAIYYDAINNPDQLLTICGTQITHNTVTAKGGGLFMAGGGLNLMDCSISGNQAEYGGGIFFGGGPGQSHYFSHSTITRNKADFGGGICFEAPGEFNPEWDNLNRCNIYLNRAVKSGQDLYTSFTMNCYPVVIDTFTVLNPSSYFACQACSFTFDILHGFGEPGNVDMYVSPAGDDHNSGLSFDDPLKSISCAIFSMSLDTVFPHTIHLAEGIYSASGTGEDFPVTMWGPVEFIGQGPGSTILDGEHVSRLIVKDDLDTDILRNMSLVAGNSLPGHGGAILAESPGTLELENIILDTNIAFKGGAVYSDSTSLKFTNVLFCRNKASYGGALFSLNAMHRFDDVTLSGNICPYGYGGGAYLHKCSVDWDNVTFDNNTASSGGGLFISKAFQNQGHGISFTNNQATGNGGAIYISGGEGVARNMIIKQNKAKHGAGIKITNSEFTLCNLALEENEASLDASAIYILRSDLNMDMVTFTGNLNEAENPCYIYSSYSSLGLTNSICWGNEPNLMKLLNTTLNVSHCDMQGGQDGIDITGTLNWLGGNIDADPLFTGSGYHPCELTAGSPCIDAGTADTTGMIMPMWDLIGNYRLWDGNGDGDTIVDMGAYEFGSMGVSTEELKFKNSKFKIEIFPNPAVGEVVVSVGSWQLAIGQNVKLTIVDLFGREVRTLEDEVNSPGEYTVRIDVSDLPAGVYMVRVQAGCQSAVRKLVVQ
jgi:predicted outer membrane repeat protein